jgi:hypothetical protein
MTTVDHQGVSPLCARLSQRREGADVTFHALLARSVRAGLRDSALLSRVGARESSVQRLFSRNGGEGSFSSAGSYNGARRPSGSGFSWITMPPTEVEAPEQAVRQRRSWWSAPKQGSRSTIQRVRLRGQSYRLLFVHLWGPQDLWGLLMSQHQRSKPRVTLRTFLLRLRLLLEWCNQALRLIT